MRMLCITGWRRLMGSRKLQIIFHNRATKYRSLLQKMTYKDQGSYESSPPCTRCCVSKQVMCIEKMLCIEPKDVVYPPQKLLGDGLSTPVPLFCLICTISRTKRVFWISTRKTNFDSAGADTSGRVRHPPYCKKLVVRDDTHHLPVHNNYRALLQKMTYKWKASYGLRHPVFCVFIKRKMWVGRCVIEDDGYQKRWNDVVHSTKTCCVFQMLAGNASEC